MIQKMTEQIHPEKWPPGYWDEKPDDIERIWTPLELFDLARQLLNHRTTLGTSVEAGYVAISQPNPKQWNHPSNPNWWPDLELTIPVEDDLLSTESTVRGINESGNVVARHPHGKIIQLSQPLAEQFADQAYRILQSLD